MNFKPTSLIVSLGLAAGAATAQTQAPAGSAPGMPLTAAQQQSMLKLEEAAKRLRESIAAMKGKSDAAERARAISQTQDALNSTQQAMAALPAEIRNAPAAAITTDQYNQSVEKMMRAADALRKSIQAMAKLPAGDARSRAIQEANQALIETNTAMVMAYTPNSSTGAMGASGGNAAGTTGSSKSGTLGSGARMPAAGGDGQVPSDQSSSKGKN